MQNKILAEARQIMALLQDINCRLQNMYGISSKQHKDKFTAIISIIAMQRYLFEDLQVSPKDMEYLEKIFSFEDFFDLPNGLPEQIRPNWDEYHMGFAINAGLRSSCYGRNVGSAIVWSNLLLTTGYNGAGRNTVSCKELAACRKEEKKKELVRNNPSYGKHRIGLNIVNTMAQKACHWGCAEATAFEHLTQLNLCPENNCTIYTTLFPCESCAEKIVQTGYIKRLVYKSDYKNKTRNTETSQNTLKYLRQHGIEVHKLRIRPAVMQLIIFSYLHPDGISRELLKPNEFEPRRYEVYELPELGCPSC